MQCATHEQARRDVTGRHWILLSLWVVAYFALNVALTSYGVSLPHRMLAKVLLFTAFAGWLILVEDKRPPKSN